ncbi:hypothetical protein D0T60_10900 [Bacteroides sp. 224]|nr:hypothetical protein [Bacteroides sp. 224]
MSNNKELLKAATIGTIMVLGILMRLEIPIGQELQMVRPVQAAPEGMAMDIVPVLILAPVILIPDHHQAVIVAVV